MKQRITQIKTITSASIIERLGLHRHPEGGYFREVFKAPATVEHPGVPAGQDSRRCAGSLIYYLLEAGDFSAFHRVRWSDEIWHFYAGGPLQLHTLDADGEHAVTTLHDSFGACEPACIVPAGRWQAARPAESAPWALCGCTVAPGFEFADFEMPARATLQALYPQHAELIAGLTRP